MQNIMVDIESLGTRPSSVILSIGAVEFDGKELGRRFHARIDIDSCLKHGLTVDGRTIEWWMTQPDKARAIFNTTGLPLDRVLLDLTSSFNWADAEVWCNGMNFDLPILENAFEAVGLPAPWRYYNGRDYRTVRKMIPADVVAECTVEPVVAHDALEDAIAQALTLQALLAAMKQV